MIFMLSHAYMAILSPTQHILDHKTPIGHKPCIGEMWIVDIYAAMEVDLMVLINLEPLRIDKSICKAAGTRSGDLEYWKSRQTL